MDATFVWAVILALAAATYFNRLSFLGLLAHVELPRLLQRILAYVPPAIIAAIIAPQIFPGGAQSLPTLDWPRLIAALLAFLVAFRTRSTLATISIGMLALWGMQAILG
ncbi:MAG: AzlD domain-containing protein [Proteobacteria bacterium]|nr:AzlD domain-containing protein [Pseudomonadota bacterium]